MSETQTKPQGSIPASYDPGLTQKYTGVLSRIITKDGKFNVRRAGRRSWKDANPYLFLISTSWWRFWAMVVLTFVLINLTFAGLYLTMERNGIGHIKGAEAKTTALELLNVFFFSTHTLTTVGYGNMYPDGPTANFIAAAEALVGLMGFAIATGLLFGRFSQPSVRFGFSPTMAIAPYKENTSLQFRVVNRRSNNLIEVEARVMLMTVESENGRSTRKYTLLELERNDILFLALTWTVVHPIDAKSPLYGKIAEDLKKLQAEVVISLKGFDETFGQIVYSRYSYRYDEITWGVKFTSAFDIDEAGDLLLWIDKVGLTEPAPLPENVS
ncbi:MAG: ion channel [Acidobacteriota bacterium]|nr:ion channel [Acidobacteriota bacterium]